MSIVLLKQIHLNYITKDILNDINLQISKGEKYALVGNNRSGKSSLMKIIAKLLEPDGGEVIYSRGVRVGYISQEIEDLNLSGMEFIKGCNKDVFGLIEEYQHKPNQHLHDTLVALQAFDFESRLNDLIGLFHVPNINQLMSDNSGGINKKIQLIAGFLFYSDLILLDEPTNHLDIKGIMELEKYLNNTQSSLVIVSHDRKFLDNVTNHFLEIWDKRTYVHKGTYANYLDAKSKRLENEAVDNWKLGQYLKRELKWVSAGVKARATKDKGRLQRFYEAKDSLGSVDNKIVEMVIPEPVQLGTRVLDIENLSIKEGDKIVFGPLTFKFEKYTKVGIVGPNGSYKSTFIKAILDQLSTNFNSQGTIKKGLNTSYLYFEQDKNALALDMTVFDYIGEGKERVNIGDQGQMNTYKYLDNWLFFKDQHRTQIRNLSGGEKSKLLLAKKLQAPANFLILDEPTNDLDLDTILLLESNLAEYEGPIIIISHDRQFLNHICNVIISTDSTSPLVSYGDYDFYESKYIKNLSESMTSTELKTPKKSPKDERRESAQIRELEKQINTLEETLKKIESQLTDPEVYSDYIKTNELVTKKERLEVRLLEYYKQIL
jgi:ABC transport system ATP-binding/permease protein